MKKMKYLLLFVLILLLCTCMWFYGYYSRKSNDNIPSKELLVSYCMNNGEDYATEKLRGYKNTQLQQVWGDPDGNLFGFWGDIWETNTRYNLCIYYDSDGLVEHVKIFEEEPQTPNALIPSIMYNGVIYSTTGKQIPAEIDESSYAGRIDATVPLSEMPAEDGQANFGEIGIPYAVISDGLIVLVNNEWTLFEAQNYSE